MAEIMAAQAKAKFGSVKEISAVDYVDEVNKAGEGVWVVLHLYKTGYPHLQGFLGGLRGEFCPPPLKMVWRPLSFSQV